MLESVTHGETLNEKPASDKPRQSLTVVYEFDDDGNATSISFSDVKALFGKAASEHPGWFSPKDIDTIRIVRNGKTATHETIAVEYE